MVLGEHMVHRDGEGSQRAGHGEPARWPDAHGVDLSRLDMPDGDRQCHTLESRSSSDAATFQIRITGRREGSVAILEVSDTGPGVPAQAREHLFEAFQTSGRPGGSGLGLAIAAELVRAHGGDIHLVEGTIGATFRIAIPDRPVELQSVRNERARA